MVVTALHPRVRMPCRGFSWRVQTCRSLCGTWMDCRECVKVCGDVFTRLFLVLTSHVCCCSSRLPRIFCPHRRVVHASYTIRIAKETSETTATAVQAADRVGCGVERWGGHREEGVPGTCRAGLRGWLWRRQEGRGMENTGVPFVLRGVVGRRRYACRKAGRALDVAHHAAGAFLCSALYFCYRGHSPDVVYMCVA